MSPSSSEDGGDAPISATLAEAVARSVARHPVDAGERVLLTDLLAFPRPPVDRDALAWTEIGPGLRLHLASEDRARGLKRCVVWGRPGARTARHDHSGDEVILVVEGRLRDDRGTYGPGEICRSRPGDVHEERVQGGEDCLCFALYYGDPVPVA